MEACGRLTATLKLRRIATKRQRAQRAGAVRPEYAATASSVC